MLLPGFGQPLLVMVVKSELWIEPKAEPTDG
jgi:hypothetical protein